VSLRVSPEDPGCHLDLLWHSAYQWM
jgi:hypothetical protein